MALIFLEREDTYSVYQGEHGESVYLAHETGKPLVEFDTLDVPELWRALRAENRTALYDPWSHMEAFRNQLRALVIDPDVVDDVHFCEGCQSPDHVDSMHPTHDDEYACESCFDDFWTCSDCDAHYRSTYTTLNDTEVCEGCRDINWSFCGDCDGYYRSSEGCGVRHGGCDCEAPAQEFQVRNDGLPPLSNDERTTVTLPAGTISDEGLTQITQTIMAARLAQKYDDDSGEWVYEYDEDERRKLSVLADDLHGIGAQVQTKQGNWTKRFSRYAHKTYGLKIRPALLSQLGNVASDHSRAIDFQVEVTRNLNLPAEDFAHRESCWWQSYSYSRCTLKNNGGFGLRSFDDYGRVTGRAWVMPLKQVDSSGGRKYLTPTFETLEPDAFVVFNGYRNLNEYIPARIMAHMAGMTYRRVGFTVTDMYVNNESGYLIAPEEIADRYTDGCLSLSVDQHAVLHADEQASTERTPALV